MRALPGPDDDELAIRARAIEAGHDPAVRAAVIAAVMPSEVGGMIETVGNDPIFEFDIIRVDVARWLDIGQPGTHAERQTWKTREPKAARREAGKRPETPDMAAAGKRILTRDTAQSEPTVR